LDGEAVLVDRKWGTEIAPLLVASGDDTDETGTSPHHHFEMCGGQRPGLRIYSKGEPLIPEYVVNKSVNVAVSVPVTVAKVCRNT
jgi:hypothetical protein